jgi:alcohol dehydrogenase YqhD (iron-dependent ADH family)
VRNFEFHLSTDLVFGKGAEEQTGKKIRQFGGSRALLVTGGGSVKKIGLFEKVTASLDAEGIPYMELFGVRPNPLMSLAYKGIDMARENDLDFIVAVGGGSCIDTAKCIALGVPYGGDVWDFYDGTASPDGALSVGCVVSIAAAGSEMGPVSVMTRDDPRQKASARIPFNRPKFALLNPEWTYTMDAWQTAAGAVDTISHAHERYFSSDENGELTDYLCEGIFKTVVHQAPIALENPEDYNARAELMLCACYAHNDVVGVGRGGSDSGSHSLSHELGAQFDVTHGASLAVVLPAWLRYNYKRAPKRFRQFFIRTFGVDESLPTDEIIQEGISRYKAWLKSIGMPVTLDELGVPESAIDSMTEKCRSDKNGYTGNHFPLSKDDVRAIYRLCL